MSIIAGAMGQAFETNFMIEVIGAIRAVTPIAFSLLAIGIGWNLVRSYFGLGDVDGSGLGFTSAARYNEWCEENDLDPDFDEQLEYMDDSELRELFENSDLVEDVELRKERLRGW